MEEMIPLVLLLLGPLFLVFPMKEPDQKHFARQKASPEKPAQNSCTNGDESGDDDKSGDDGDELEVLYLEKGICISFEET